MMKTLTALRAELAALETKPTKERWERARVVSLRSEIFQHPDAAIERAVEAVEREAALRALLAPTLARDPQFARTFRKVFG